SCPRAAASASAAPSASTTSSPARASSGTRPTRCAATAPPWAPSHGPRVSRRTPAPSRHGSATVRALTQAGQAAGERRKSLEESLSYVVAENLLRGTGRALRGSCTRQVTHGGGRTNGFELNFRSAVWNFRSAV